MALRYSSKSASVTQAGTAFTHALGAAPDEWAINFRGAPGSATALYLSTITGTTSVTFAAVGATATADVFLAVNHSIMQ